MKHTVQHDLGKARAKQVTEKALESYQAKLSDYKPTAEWTTEDHAEIAFTAKGFTLKGSLDVKETAIELELSVPFLLKPFQGTAIGVIEKEINVWIGKAKAGEL